MIKKNFLLVVIILLFTTILFSGCTTDNNNQTVQPKTKGSTYTPPVVDFTGQKGQSVSITDNQITLDNKIFNDNLAHFYNTQLNGKTIYFFVIKDKDGIYRAAANACQVCFDARMGFRQEGDYMVCNTCGNKYPLTKIATEKGGCNPGPINPNLETKNDKIIIEQSDLNQVVDLF